MGTLILEVFKSTWKGAAWFLTATVGGTLFYSDVMHAIQVQKDETVRVKQDFTEFKDDIKDDLKEIKSDLKQLVRDQNRNNR